MEGTDCGIVVDGRKFRYRAAAIIIEDGMMLLMENDRDRYMYTVGGAVRIGETAEDAATRECIEEIGVGYEPERLVVVQEEFYPEPVGDGTFLDAHEVGFFFMMRPRGTREGVLERSRSEGMEERAVWVPLDDLCRHEIVPGFLRDPESVGGPLRHIVTHLR